MHSCQSDHLEQSSLYAELPAAATEEEVQTPGAVALAVVEAVILTSLTAKRKSANVQPVYCVTTCPKTRYKTMKNMLLGLRKQGAKQFKYENQI